MESADRPVVSLLRGPLHAAGVGFASFIMARRRNDDVVWDVARLIGLLGFFGIIYEPTRNLVGRVTPFLPWIFIAGVVVLASVGIYRDCQGKSSLFETSTPPTSTRDPMITEALIERLRSIDWFQFEKVVALVYRKLGFSVARRGGANPDGGIDLIITKDGRNSAVQCKTWQTWSVGVKTVREFLGALTDARIQTGVVITLCGSTAEGKKLAEKHGIQIVAETGLAKMIDDAGIRFDPELQRILHDTRKMCPKCEREMVLRTATRGQDAGKQFWGCSAYPRCRFTMPV
jgi:HJR/Mrr/RecB family endonuclease